MKVERFFGLVLGLALTLVVTLNGVAGVPPDEAASRVSGSPARLAASLCPPLEAPTGPTVTLSSESALRDRAYNAAAGTTIMVSAGTYNMNGYIHVVNDGIAIRGATGNRGDVILDFGGMESGHFGILVEADDVTIANLTIRNAHDHGVSIQGRDRPTLYNLHI